METITIPLDVYNKLEQAFLLAGTSPSWYDTYEQINGGKKAWLTVEGQQILRDRLAIKAFIHERSGAPCIDIDAEMERVTQYCKNQLGE